jgi:hypothetical protein
MSADPDRTLEQLLADTAALRARLREENAEAQPPAYLDDAILAASRRAVSSRPVVAGGSPRLRRWQVPLAAAAVVVLATSVALLTLQEGEHERVLESAPSSVPAPASESKRLEQLEKDVRARTAESPSPQRRADESGVHETQRPELRASKTMPQGDGAPSQAPPMPLQQRPATPAATAPSAELPMAPDSAELFRQAPAVADSTGPAAERGANAIVAPRAATIGSSERVRQEKLELEPEKSRSSGRAQVPEKRAAAADAQSPQDELADIRKRWEAGDQAGAREALTAFFLRHPGYALPPGYPVPGPAAPPAQERSPGDR